MIEVGLYGCVGLLWFLMAIRSPEWDELMKDNPGFNMKRVSIISVCVIFWPICVVTGIILIILKESKGKFQ